MTKRIEGLYLISLVTGIIILVFTVYPVLNTFTWTRPDILLKTMRDPEVLRAVWLSIWAATLATLVSLVLGLPFAYLLARKEFRGKSLVESLVDIPIVLPHTVAGICLLTVLSPRSAVGRWLEDAGLQTLGTIAGTVLAMIFVSMPLFINACKEAFKWVSPRMENVSRTLGAGPWTTFFRITLALSWKDILSGMIVTWARSISEFGAVVILAFHPMIAPTLIFARFTAYGMTYAIPVAIILIVICLLIFVALRLLSVRRKSFD